MRAGPVVPVRSVVVAVACLVAVGRFAVVERLAGPALAALRPGAALVAGDVVGVAVAALAFFGADDFTVAFVAVAFVAVVFLAVVLTAGFGVVLVTGRFGAGLVAAVLVTAFEATVGADFLAPGALLALAGAGFAAVRFAGVFGIARVRAAPFFAGGRAVPALFRAAGAAARGVDLVGGAVAAALARRVRGLLGGGVVSAFTLDTSAPFQRALMGELARSGARMVRIDRQSGPL